MIAADLSIVNIKRAKLLSQQKAWYAVLLRKTRRLFITQPNVRLWGYGAFILMSLLSASFYPVAKPALDHIDTAMFLAGQMMWLLPPALCLLIWSHGRINWRTLLWGCGLGSCMSIALLCLTLAMDYTSITETAMFSCMNGILVVLISWLLFRHRVHLLTWLACLCSIVGIVVLLSVSNMHWGGDLLAFLGGLLLTGYSFLIEKLSLRPEHNSVCSLRAVFGIEWLTMVIEMLIYALLYGNWQSVHFMLPHMATFAYVGLVTTLLPMVTMMVMRRYVNGVMLTFLGTLEPVAGAIFAFFFAHEHFLPLMYLGGMLIVGSLVLQALAGCTGLSSFVRNWWRKFHLFHKVQVQASAPTRRLLSRSSWPQGRRAHILFTQFLFVSEGVDLLTLQRLTGMPCRCVYRLLAFLQKQGYVISYQNHGARYYMLHPSWQVSGHLREVLS